MLPPTNSGTEVMLPTDAHLLAACLVAGLIGLLTNSAARLAIVCGVLIALHILLVVTLPTESPLPYFIPLRYASPAAMAILLFGAYVAFLAAAFVGYGIRIIALRLFKRAA
jgi:hypothetical protein